MHVYDPDCKWCDAIVKIRSEYAIAMRKWTEGVELSILRNKQYQRATSEFTQWKENGSPTINKNET